MIKITLKDKQVRVLLAILDCTTSEKEPDWFFDEKRKLVKTPFLEKNNTRTLQKHLDVLLKRKNFPDIFG